MAEITIKHDHEGGTRLEGSTRGDGAYEILAALSGRGWTFRSWAGIHIRGSRDRFTRHAELERDAEALRAAGHTVTVEIDNTWRPAAVRWAEREERAGDRADRYDDRAGKAAGRSEAAYEGVRRIGDGIPMGQPILVGHHSQRRAERDRDRMDAGMRKSIDEAKYAGSLADRAAGSRANEAHKHHGPAIIRRIDTLETETRKLNRSLADGAAGGWADVARLIVARNAEEVTYLRGLLAEKAEAGGFVAWSPDSITKGDLVRVESFGWYRVTRVNRKSVSLDSQSWPHTAEWDRITGRRRDGEQIDRPGGQGWPVELADRVACWGGLLRSAAGYPHDDAARRRNMHVAWAQRMVHGLDLGAADAELTAARGAERLADMGGAARELAARYLAVYDRLTADEPVAAILADLAPERAAGGWMLPDREPEDLRTGPLSLGRDDGRQVKVGDLVKGVWDRGYSGRTLVRSFCGPVAAVSPVNNRRESGEWVTITLQDGTARDFQTHTWLAVYPAGTWEQPGPAASASEGEES